MCVYQSTALKQRKVVLVKREGNVDTKERERENISNEIEEEEATSYLLLAEEEKKKKELVHRHCLLISPPPPGYNSAI